MVKLYLQRCQCLAWIPLAVALVCGSVEVFAQTTTGSSTPATLAKWREWILEKHPEHACVVLAYDAEKRVCAWPATLKAEIGTSGMRFSQSWRLDAPGLIPLPGNIRLWPLDVTVDDKPAKILRHQNGAGVQLDAGKHRISGFIPWAQAPQQLPLPSGSYRVQLLRDGEPVETPFISQDGALWLSRPENERDSERDAVVIEVFRSILDTLPRKLLTEVHLSVSGSPRELQAGALRLPDTTTEWLKSPLPAKLEDDGKLRIQVRSGKWTVSHLARFNGDINVIRPVKQTDNWPTQELWGFEPHLELRRVRLSGASQVDANQVEHPGFLNGRALYLLKHTDTLTLEEIDRGMDTTITTELSLAREIWPAIRGSSAIFNDVLTGEVHALWRLETDGSFDLGRAEVGGKPVVVTKLTQDSGSGFELESSTVNVNATSSIASLDQLGASAWQTNFLRVQHILHLPPTWRVWHISGPDSVTGSWLAKWDLWSIFLCLLVVGAFLRLQSWLWAAVALASGLLHYHSPGGIYYWVLPLLVFLPLLRVLPQNTFRTIVQITTACVIFLATMAIIEFSVSHIRGIIYPQLADKVHVPGYARETAFQDLSRSAVQEPSRIEIEADALEEVVVSSVRSPAPKSYFESKKISEFDTVQTGPGIPNWRWDTVRYAWSGPVVSSQPLQIWKTEGWQTQLISLLEWIVVVAMFAGLLRALLSTFGKISFSEKVSLSDKQTKTTAAGILGIGMLSLAALGTPETSHAENFPPSTLLEEYEKRLTAKPTCAPHCYSISKGRLSIDQDVLRIDLSVSVDADAAVPIPSSEKWTAVTVSANGKNLPYVKRMAGKDHVPLTAGVHSLRMQGRVQADKFTLSFPEHSFNIQVQVDDKDWLVSGLQSSGLQNKVLSGQTLSFEKREKTSTADILLQENAAKFAEVRRKLSLGQDWNIETLVQRIAPASGAIQFKIPLLPGEKVLSQDIEVKDGFAVVQLGGTTQTISWRSQMEPVRTLTLRHADSSDWTETWSVQASSRWHLEHSGLNPIQRENKRGREWYWMAWPGESVELQLARPKAAEGRTITINQVTLKSNPGLRVADYRLVLKARSSLGEEYRLTLPEGADLKNVQVNGQDTPSRLLDNKLALPLRPGENVLDIQWQINAGIRNIFSTPKIELQTPARNIEVKVSLPRHRWPLFLSGPQLGPAVLFWSTLTVILLLAIGLGMLRKRFAPTMPLSTTALILLGLGLSTAWKLTGLLILIWFILFEVRKRKASVLKPSVFNLSQVALVGFSVIALLSLAANVPYGLLSTPNMSIVGNQSSGYLYTWYSDEAATILPQATVISVSMWFYRLAMLLWSLWLVFALLKWLRWGWQCFSDAGLWRSTPKAEPKTELKPPSE